MRAPFTTYGDDQNDSNLELAGLYITCLFSSVQSNSLKHHHLNRQSTAMIIKFYLSIVFIVKNELKYVKGELNPKINFSSFEHLGIVEQLYEVFLSC